MFSIPLIFLILKYLLKKLNYKIFYKIQYNDI